MNLTAKLQEYGLQPKEAEVYLALLELGQATIHELAHKCDIKRTSLYDVLERLKNLKLVNETQTRGKLLYYLDGPEKILEWWRAKEKEAKQKIVGLDELLPLLKQIYSARAQNRPKIKIYEGRDGIRRIFDDILTSEQKEVWSVISRRDAIEAVGENFYREFIKKRVATKIKSFGFRTDADAAPAQTTPGRRQRENEFLRESYYLPTGMNFKASLMVYDNKLAVFTSIKERYGFILESEEIAATLKILLKTFWGK